MKLKYLKKENVYRYDLDEMSPEEFKMLKETGLERIKNDDRALIEYAVTSILMDQIKKLSDEDDNKLNKKNKKLEKIDYATL